MNTASLDLCKELWLLSGWDDVTAAYFDDGYPRQVDDARTWDKPPAYDLGYLLRKLPKYIPTYEDNRLPADDYQLGIVAKFDDEWVAQYAGLSDRPLYIATADTPEDAAAKLAIKLFKQGILTRSDKGM